MKRIGWRWPFFANSASGRASRVTEFFKGTATICDGSRRNACERILLRCCATKKRSHHETRNIGIGNSAGVHKHFRAVTGRRRRRGRRFGRGWRFGRWYGCRRRDRILHRRNDRRKRNGYHRDEQRRRKCRSGSKQCSEPVGQHSHQSLTERFDRVADRTRLAERPVTEKPRDAGLRPLTNPVDFRRGFVF